MVPGWFTLTAGGCSLFCPEMHFLLLCVDTGVSGILGFYTLNCFTSSGVLDCFPLHSLVHLWPRVKKKGTWKQHSGIREPRQFLILLCLKSKQSGHLYLIHRCSYLPALCHWKSLTSTYEWTLLCCLFYGGAAHELKVRFLKHHHLCHYPAICAFVKIVLHVSIITKQWVGNKKN